MISCDDHRDRLVFHRFIKSISKFKITLLLFSYTRPIEHEYNKSTDLLIANARLDRLSFHE